MLQIVVPKKYNIEQLFYSGEKDFQKTRSGLHYYKNYEYISEELIEEIKAKFKKPTFFLYMAEMGGEEKDKYKSYSQIVCDSEGGKIYPIFKIYGKRANSAQAYFRASDLCTVEVYFKDKHWYYKITHHVIDKFTGKYEKEVLIENKIKNRVSMPKKLKIFNDAIDAAMLKAQDYQCTKIYYSI